MKNSNRLFLLSLWIGLTIFQARINADEINFNRDIRPILSDKCFACHGPDEKAIEGGLRLDLREDAMEYEAIVPGQPDESEIVSRVTSNDPDYMMPPPSSGKTLSKSEAEKIQLWVLEGAKYSQHWAFVSPQSIEIPKTKNSTWAINPVDQFILSKLESLDLKPSPPADKLTLLRRVTLDLTGLPPTPLEQNAFLSDESPEAYEKVVDRLLASQNYGERMAINWLDYARYADSNGFQSDGSRTMWAWRDWVITAYNNNMPFDQFTIEQIAGDMLPSPSRDQIIATGFNRNHRLNGEGGFIAEEWFVETVIDRLETTGMTWLGLTFNCCRCHDHKYDPISQKEFYQMFAYFNSCEETGVLTANGKNGDNTPPVMSLMTDQQKQQLDRLTALSTEAETSLNDVEKQLERLLAEWKKSQLSRLKDPKKNANIWVAPEPKLVESLGGAVFKRLDDDSFLATGKNPAKDTYRIVLPRPADSLSGVMLEVMPDASLPNQSLGRGSNGNFVMTGVEVVVVDGETRTPIEFIRAQADFEQPGWTAATVLGGKPSESKDNYPRQGWAIAGFEKQNRVTRHIMFVMDKKVDLKDSSHIEVEIRNHSQFADHNIGRFKVYVTDADPKQVSLAKAGLPQNVAAALFIEEGKRRPDQRELLNTYYLDHVDNPIRAARTKLTAARANVEKFRNSLPTTMVMKEGKIRDAFVLTRGEYDQPGSKVARKTPSFLPPLPEGQPNNRLGLANWIVDRSNPLTARVWVNRQWEKFFGTGIVKTTENFGSQSDFPSHLDLLDWLAVEFMTPSALPYVNGQPPHNWDMKAVQKLILMSATYRQSSKVDASLTERDPKNRLLARGPRFRLAGELIRDQALAASGLLVNKIGGPSVRPYMPEGVWNETSRYGNLRNYKHDDGDGLYRRSLYTIWKRTAAPPTMLMFDAPNREACTIKRSKTNTPLQALSLLNEVTFVEAARAMANRMISEGGDDWEERISYGFQLALGRRPTESELEVLGDGFLKDLSHFQAHPDAASNLIKIGSSKNKVDSDLAELAAYTVTSNVILNLDEFVTRE